MVIRLCLTYGMARKPSSPARSVKGTAPSNPVGRPRKGASAPLSRESGAELLITSAIDIASRMPVSKVTVRDLVAAAGLQTMHVKRYFGSRNGLLAAASNRLMQRIVDDIVDRPLTEMLPYLLESEDIGLRLRIVNHLLSEGVPPSTFASDRGVYLRIAERISEVNGVGERTAHAYALVIQLVLQGNRLMGEVNGLNSDERHDIFGLLAAIGAALPGVESSLEW